MRSKWAWWLSQIARRIWFRATLFSVLAVATALLAAVAAPYIPATLPGQIGADAVDNILSIIASSMLAVTTFSLSTMVSAYSAASSSVTPRATSLIMEDSTTQNVLATFIGSFLFSLVGIIALTTGAYGETGRLVLFLVTIGVIILVVVTLLRWIDHLSRLGSVTETTERVEKATARALETLAAAPYLGGQPLRDAEGWNSPTAAPVSAPHVGYVQHVDVGALSNLAEEFDIDIAVVAIAGTLVSPNMPVGLTSRSVSKEVCDRIAASFSLAHVRSFDQDPRFGASVLTEIASRALSPAVNDPGTAIDVISRALRLLVQHAGNLAPADAEVSHPRLHVKPVALADLFDDLFMPIARDGAALVEVGLRLQKAFEALACLPNREVRAEAHRHSAEALDRAEAALVIDADKDRLRREAEAVRVLCIREDVSLTGISRG